jgi:hypothetical protein
VSDYTKFYLCLGGLCLLFPPLLGLVIGVGMFVAAWYLFYKILGG